MAPELLKVAQEVGREVRVCKLDSDSFPDLVGELRVTGYPTLIFYDGGGKELDRLEGMRTMPEIMGWVAKFL